MGYSNYMTKINESFRTAETIPFTELLKEVEVENRSSCSGLGISVSPFIRSFKSDCARYSQDPVVTSGNYEIERFLKNNFFVEFKKDVGSFTTFIQLSGYNKYLKNDYSIAEDSDIAMDQILSKLYDRVLSDMKKIFDFYYKGKDSFYHFSCKNLPNFNDVMLLLKNEVFSKISTFEKFEKLMRPILTEKISDYLNIEYYKTSLKMGSKVYMLEENLSFDEIMNKGMPTVNTFEVIRMRTVENEGYTTPDIVYYLSDHPSNDKTMEFHDIEYRSLQIIQNKRNVNARYYSNGKLVFFSKEDADVYYKNKLRMIKERINSVLRDDSIATY